VIAFRVSDAENFGVQFRRLLPADAPDPRIEQRERLRDMPAPVMGLIAQPTLQDTEDLSISAGHDSAGLVDFTVGISYTLWRNPAERSDPVNLAALDDHTRTLIEQGTPWPRPRWLVERVERMRYPQMWEAVRTNWSREVSEHTKLAYQLAAHVDYILTNRYSDQDGQTSRVRRQSALRDLAASVNSDVSVVVDGVETPAAEIETDLHVYAIGIQLAPATVVTAVLPRDELRYIEIAFVTRSTTDMG
jgi:hypothetical protein